MFRSALISLALVATSFAATAQNAAKPDAKPAPAATADATPETEN